MSVSFKVGLLTLIASVFAAECLACRYTRVFNPDEIEADLVVRGQLVSYTHPRQQALEEGVGRDGVLFSDAILCIRTLDTYLGEKRDEWCFDVDLSTLSAPSRDEVPDDVIIAANAFGPFLDEYARSNQRWFEPLGVEKRVYNAGCTAPYLIPFSEEAEQDMIERFVRGEIAPNCGSAATLKTDDSKVKSTGGLTQHSQVDPVAV